MTASGFTYGRAIIATKDGPLTIDAWLHGNVAVHRRMVLRFRAIRGGAKAKFRTAVAGKGWDVTALPCGLKIPAVFPTMKRACAVALLFDALQDWGKVRADIQADGTTRLRGISRKALGKIGDTLRAEGILLDYAKPARRKATAP